jgi:hypothetical protein
VVVASAEGHGSLVELGHRGAVPPEVSECERIRIVDGTSRLQRRLVPRARLLEIPRDRRRRGVPGFKGQNVRHRCPMLRTSFLVIASAALIAAPAATGSDLIARDAKDVMLAVNAKGEGLLTYKVAGKTQRVLAWGAVDAIAPTKARPQVRFKLDYQGGWKKYRRTVWKAFPNVCKGYDGPPLGWLVAACKAPDGSYWAVQSWQRALPNYGAQPTPTQAVWELRLSHWRGDLPVLAIELDWAYRRFDHLFGLFTYRGGGVFGFKATPAGVPLDTFGRNVYVDTLDSAYGAGWRRENSFLTHSGSGAFCYGFYPHGTLPAGTGTRYRATVIGPGVTPDIFRESPAPGAYDAARDNTSNEGQRKLFGSSGPCRPN